LEYIGGPAGEARSYDRGANSYFFKKSAAVVVVALLAALGIKFVSDGVDVAGESSNRGLALVALALVSFAVAIPILFFIVLGFAHP
jgi:hypothetical protein